MAHVDPENAHSVAGAGGEAAASAAEQGRTSEQAQAETAAAMRAKADEEGIAITDEDIGRIAAGTIAMLEARGAFEQAPAGGAPSSEPPANASTPANEGSGEGGAEPSPSTASTSPSEESPRKKTWAERFQGK